jgi:hypothetical protein
MRIRTKKKKAATPKREKKKKKGTPEVERIPQEQVRPYTLQDRQQGD